MSNNEHLKTTAYTLFIVLSLGFLLYIGSSLFIPLVFATFLAVILSPVDVKLRKLFKFKSISIIASFILLLIPFVLVTILFSYQLMSISDSLPSIDSSLRRGIEKLFTKVNALIPILDLDSKKIISQSTGEDISGPLKFIGQSLISTSKFFTGAGVAILFTFFFLYYKGSIKNYIIHQFNKKHQEDTKDTLGSIQETIQSYIAGLGLVVVILSVLNSLGLFLIGIDYAIFWGVLGGILAMIPFIGTLIGGALPFAFAVATSDSIWPPILILIYYLIIQQVEGNLITPKIIGDKVDINPMFAILALLIFGSFWGISGVVLAIPLISICKIVMSQFDSTLPIATLMGSNIDKKKGIFKRM